MLFAAAPAWAKSAEPSAKAGKPATKPGYHVVLQTAAGGNYDQTFSDQGIVIKSTAFNFKIIASAPEWTVYVVRDDTKEIAHATIAEFSRVKEAVVGSASTVSFKKVIGTRRFHHAKFNIDGVEYTYPGEQISNQLFASEGKPLYSDKFTICTYDMNVPAQVKQIVAANVSVPNNPGMFGFALEYQRGGTMCWMTRTIALEKLAAVPDSLFKTPVGYKDVGRLERQFMYKNVSDAMDEIIGGFEPEGVRKAPASGKGK